MINLLIFSELIEGQCYEIWKEYSLVTNRYDDHYQTYNNISRNSNQPTGKQEKK